MQKDPSAPFVYSFKQAITAISRTDPEGIEKMGVTVESLRNACIYGLLEHDWTRPKGKGKRRITQNGFHKLRDLVTTRTFKQALKVCAADWRLQNSRVAIVPPSLEHSETELEAHGAASEALATGSEVLDSVSEVLDTERVAQEAVSEPPRPSELPPGSAYTIEQAAVHLRIDVERLEQFVQAGDLKAHGDKIHLTSIISFISTFDGSYVIPLLAGRKFADQVSDLGDGFIQVGRLVDGVETIDAFPDEYLGPAFPAHESWYAVWP